MQAPPPPPPARRIIDGVGKTVQGVSGVMLAISPTLGPAGPVAAGISTCLSLLAGGMMVATETATPCPDQQLDALTERVNSGFNMLGLQLAELTEETRKVQKAINKLAEDLSQQVTQVLHKLTQVQIQLVQNYMKRDLVDMRIIHSRHQDFLDAVQSGMAAKDIHAILSRTIRADQVRYDQLRQGLEGNLDTWLNCESCGGKAAAALWFTQAYAARVEIFNLMYFYDLVDGHVDMAVLRRRHLEEDSRDWTAKIVSLGLGCWLRLQPEELAPYLQVPLAVQGQARQWGTQMRHWNATLRVEAARNLRELAIQSRAAAAMAVSELQAAVQAKTMLASGDSSWGRDYCKCVYSRRIHGAQGFGCQRSCTGGTAEWFSVTRNGRLLFAGEEPWKATWEVGHDPSDILNKGPWKNYTTSAHYHPIEAPGMFQVRFSPENATDPRTNTAYCLMGGYERLLVIPSCRNLVDWRALHVASCVEASRALGAIGFPAAVEAAGALRAMADHVDPGDVFRPCADAAQAALQELQPESAGA